MQPSEKAGKDNRKKSLPFRILRRTVRLFVKKYKLYGTENLPEEPCVLVGNHSQAYGPLAAEYCMPRESYIWCVGEMLNRKEIPAYAFKDFWENNKPPRTHWFYKMLGHLIAPLAAYALSNAHTVPVYRDNRVVTTFRRSVDLLEEGADIVIFPEKVDPYNAIIGEFNEYFAFLARIYYQKTQKALRFTPMYIAPNLNSIHFGKPVCYNPEGDDRAEIHRISAEMMKAITDIAVALPEHTVVPYVNMPKNQYPKNTDSRPALRAE
jgi:hypothetical protein